MYPNFKGRESIKGIYKGNKYTILPYLGTVRLDLRNGTLIIGKIENCISYFSPYIVQMLFPKRYRIHFHYKHPWKCLLVDLQDKVMYVNQGFAPKHNRPVSWRNQYFRKYFAVPTFFPKIKGIYVDINGNKSTSYE